MSASPNQSSPSATFDPEVLVAHVAFVKRLARGLVRGADAAEELAAETVGAALVQRPETGPAFRGWLRRVAGRLSRRAAIGAANRAERERVVARFEATPPMDELAAQMELQRKVAALFAALDEPYHSTLFRRYFHDRTPTQIAAETGVPLATVKSRLQRGLEQLRERLDARHQGRRDEWLAALVPLIGGPTLVTTKLKLLPIAAAALLLVGGGVFLAEKQWRDRDDRARALPTAAPPLEEATGRAAKDGAETGVPGQGTSSTPDRELVSRTVEELPFASGLVVDAAGTPLAGVDVVASRLDRRPMNDVAIQETLHLERLERDRLATSDERGRFVVRDPGQELATLLFLRPGYALAEWSELAADRARNQDQRIVLEKGERLGGRVVDTSSKPVAAASLSLVQHLEQVAPELQTGSADRIAANLPDAPKYLSLSGTQNNVTDGKGAFAFASCRPGPFRLNTFAGGYAMSHFQGESPRNPCEIVLTRSALLLDVTDADTHAPLRAAMVVTEAKSGEVLEPVVPWVPADPDHSFVPVPGRLMLNTSYGMPAAIALRSAPQWLMHGGARPQTASARVDLLLHVFAEGYVGDVVETSLAADEEPPHLQLELTPVDGTKRDAAIAGRVVGLSAATPATLSVYCLLPNWDQTYLESRGALLSKTCDADGTFRFCDLPDGRYRIAARADGFAPAWAEVVAPARDIAIEMKASVSFVVLVRNRSGQPAAGAVVHVQSSDDQRAWSAKTDASGTATIEGLPAGSYRAGAFENLLYDLADASIVHPQDRSTFPDRTLVEAKAGEPTRLELALVERVPVRFHFDHDDGSPVAAAQFEFSNFNGPVAAAYREFEQLRHFQVTIDSLGDATAALYPGHYQFRVSEKGPPRTIDFDVPNHGDASVEIRLPVLGPSGLLIGKLIELGSGAPIARRMLTAYTRDEAGKHVELGFQETGTDGSFEFDALPPGPVELWIYAAHLGGHGRSVIPDPTSPYGFAYFHTSVAADATTEVEVALPPIHAKNPSYTTKPCDVLITDATTGAPLENCSIDLYATVGVGEFFVATLQTDVHGSAQADLFAADHYRATIAGPENADGSTLPTYRRRELRFDAEDDVLTLETTLDRR